MALVSAGYQLTVNLIDTAARKFSKRYDLVATDMTQATTDAATIIAALNGITTCTISGYSLGEKFAEDALAYPANSNGHDQAVVVVNLETLGKTANLSIPGADAGIFVATDGVAANRVDPNDTALLTYVGLFQATGGVATISDGEAVDDTTPIDSGRRDRKAD